MGSSRMMMLTSRTILGQRPLYARTAAASAIASARPGPSSLSSLLRPSSPIQVRAFRIDLWSNYFDADSRREFRRRQRILKDMYVKSIGRRPVWHDLEPLLAGHPKLAMLRAVTRFWGPTAARNSPPWASRDDVSSHKTAKSSSTWPPAWSSRVDQDADSTPRQTPRQTPPDSKSPRDSDVRAERQRSERRAETSPPKHTFRNEPNFDTEHDSVIDPITNRRVPKREREPRPADLEPPARTFKTYSSQFIPFAPPDLEPETPPVHSNGTPPASELDKYARGKFDDWPAAGIPSSTESHGISDPPKSTSYVSEASKLKAEEYSLNHLPLEDPMEDDNEIDMGRPSEPSESVTKRSDTPKRKDAIDLETKRLESEFIKYGLFPHLETPFSSGDGPFSKELKKYQFENYSEEPEPSTEPSAAYDDLHKYENTDPHKITGLHKYESTDLKDSKDEGQLFQQYGDLEQYKAFRLQHLDTAAAAERDIVAESLKEYEAKERDDPGVTKTPRGIPEMTLPEGHMFSKHYSYNESNVAKEEVPEQPQSSTRLEPALDRCASGIQSNHLKHGHGADLYSKEPQGLETSFAEECGGKNAMPLYTRTYSSEPGQVSPQPEPASASRDLGSPEHSPELFYDRDPEVDGIPASGPTKAAREQKTTQSKEPTIYKILAYDPTMQAINIAETSSIVPDLEQPLSPTEVLPRLSNPTKFFPHFAPLQAEGFEIVSGSGNILVFRQMQPAKATIQGGATRVNPIDLMGHSPAVPNAAAFVSPTGFVNYDVPLVEEEPVVPSDRSNNDIRAEKTGSTQQKDSSSGTKGKKAKMGVGKRMVIGGVWMAGISYALGVVIEYFNTGGTDGKGPTGFSPM